MRICRIVFELWTKIVSGGQKNCAYLKNTSINEGIEIRDERPEINGKDGNGFVDLT